MWLGGKAFQNVVELIGTISLLALRTVRKFFSILFLVTVVSVRGQSPMDAFDPDANNVVRVIVVQPNGNIFSGGDLTMLSQIGARTVAQNQIARLTRDGTVKSPQKKISPFGWTT